MTLSACQLEALSISGAQVLGARRSSMVLAFPGLLELFPEVSWCLKELPIPCATYFCY